MMFEVRCAFSTEELGLTLCSGDVKIFDFGLSKEFNPTKKTASGMYHLTECTGSPRYMAPEVALGQPYNETSDVYSFSLLLWQVLKLATPFNGLNIGQLQKDVYKGGLRPKMNRSWPRSIRTMIKYGWGKAQDRPSMKEMVTVLRMECGIESISHITDEATNEPRVSQSFISAINLGYTVEPPTQRPNHPQADREDHLDDLPDIGESQSYDDEDDDDEKDIALEDQLLDYATADESDMPCVSFIMAEDLPQLLGDEKEDDEVAEVPIQTAPQMMLFPFTPSR